MSSRLTQDNIGTVKHGKLSDKVVPEKQVQEDLIALLKKVICELPSKFDCEDVCGHLDEILQWYQLIIVHKLNILCDSLVKRVLMTVIVNTDFIDKTFPFEDVLLRHKNNKLIN